MDKSIKDELAPFSLWKSHPKWEEKRAKDEILPFKLKLRRGCRHAQGGIRAADESASVSLV